MVFYPGIMDPLCHDDDGLNLRKWGRTLPALDKLSSTLGTEQGRRHYNKLSLRKQARLRGPTRNRKKTNHFHICKNNPKSKSYDSADAPSCSEDEEEREAEERVPRRSLSRNPSRSQQRRRPRRSRRPPLSVS